jgi:hypothetical protein
MLLVAGGQQRCGLVLDQRPSRHIESDLHNAVHKLIDPVSTNTVFSGVPGTEDQDVSDLLGSGSGHWFRHEGLAGWRRGRLRQPTACAVPGG